MATNIQVLVKRGPGIGKHLDNGNVAQPLPTSTARPVTLMTANIRSVRAISSIAEFDSTLTGAAGTEIKYDGGNVTIDTYWVTANLGVINAAL